MAKAKAVKKAPAKKSTSTTAPVKKSRLTKKELESKKFLGFTLYMGGEEQKMISEYLEVSEKTVSAWATEGKWKEKRSANTITRDELINKTLAAIGKLLDEALAEGDKNFSTISNSLSQLAKTIETLDKKNNVVDMMNAYQQFNNYLVERLQFDKELTTDFIKKVNLLQIKFVDTKMSA